MRARRLSAAERVLADAPNTERRRLLAMRAAFGLPYETLLAHTPDPLGALGDGHYEPRLNALYRDAGSLHPARHRRDRARTAQTPRRP